MRLDFCTNLPSEIITNILLRLPFRSIAISKCVCKPWLHLLETDYFVKSHFSKSVPALALLMPAIPSSRCKIFEFEDEVDLERHDLHYNRLTNFDFPFGDSSMEGTAANGFLLLYSKPKTLYICNPFIREYVKLCCPQESVRSHWLTYGFGVSKISGQHKVICINNAAQSGSDHIYVYTLGTGIWRRVQAGVAFGCNFYRAFEFGKFVNGNLYWMVKDLNCDRRISGFDLETECFTIFSLPFKTVDEEYATDDNLSVLRDCLCVCCRTWDDNIVIWLMKEYGVEKSWTKEYVIPIIPDFNIHSDVYPIKVFKYGDILILCDEKLLIYYSNKTKTTQLVGKFNDAAAGNNLNHIYPMSVTPSLLSLKSFGMENVISF